MTGRGIRFQTGKQKFKNRSHPACKLRHQPGIFPSIFMIPVHMAVIPAIVIQRLTASPDEETTSFCHSLKISCKSAVQNANKYHSAP